MSKLVVCWIYLRNVLSNGDDKAHVPLEAMLYSTTIYEDTEEKEQLQIQKSIPATSEKTWKFFRRRWGKCLDCSFDMVSRA